MTKDRNRKAGKTLSTLSENFLHFLTFIEISFGLEHLYSVDRGVG